jgi:hypothetical protein
MNDQDQVDIERELRAAMGERVGALPSPRFDMRALRRRRAMRRRVAVPVLVAALGLAVAAPIALAKGMLPVRLGGSGVGNPVSSTAITTAPAPSGAGQPGIGQPPDGGSRGGTGSQPRPGAAPSQPSAPAISSPGPVADCVKRSAPLGAADWAALRRDAGSEVAGAQDTLRQKLGEAGSPRISTQDVDHLLPPAGSAVAMLDCAGRSRLDPDQRAAILHQVRAAVLTTGAVSRALVDQMSGLLGSTGAVTGEVTAVQTTDRTMVAHMAFGSALTHQTGTVIAIMRLPDCAVVKLDMSGLDQLGLGPLGGLDVGHLRDSLSDLGARLQGIAPGVLAPDATLVAPSGS